MKIKELLSVLNVPRVAIFSGSKEIHLEKIGPVALHKLHDTDVIDVRTTSSGAVHISVDEKQFPIEETPMEVQLRDILATLAVDAKIYLDEDNEDRYIFLDVENNKAHLYTESRLSISHKDGFKELEPYLTHAVSKISDADMSTISIYVK